MTKIWRVENKEGRGCYQGQSHKPFIGDMIARHDLDEIRTPMPYNDKGIGRCSKSPEICGFVNKKQAQEWFSKDDLILLKDFGFDLKEVEVSRITATGRRQILAVRG